MELEESDSLTLDYTKATAIKLLYSHQDSMVPAQRQAYRSV